MRLGAKNVTMDVTVDGDRSAALGVMSQGELYALALSLFIPRVRSNDTPFGFVMLDDPVQAMDPVRVERLANVLGELAQTHQVVVFTHDNRLPAAINQHQIPATTVEVNSPPEIRGRTQAIAQSGPSSHQRRAGRGARRRSPRRSVSQGRSWLLSAGHRGRMS